MAKMCSGVTSMMSVIITTAGPWSWIPSIANELGIDVDIEASPIEMEVVWIAVAVRFDLVVRVDLV
eukprot:CAMPEP_0204625556 /NCGR_PEP_ID=MMETSP0717-20131115/11314_1 /ASSEMBLY_ACC=CAM_ASM_000666 /TAXON_ID=230516 /ORGANISM="Chaetoceros curvisetus" /LENGTH=65 /DNA_ID=CAMNT_0051641291 /DNA_START=271 /DNA_END=468 /DNA_ORIENTATION=-